MVVSNMTLVKIASIGGIATVTMGLLTRSKLSNNVKSTEYYKDALKTLRSHKASIHLLGEPIKDGTIDVSNKENYTKTYSAKYEVPVRGPKERGILYFWAEKTPDSEKWTVTRMELGLKNHPDKRLLVKKLDQNS